MTISPKQRDVSLDVAKGLCIILMVMGHAGCTQWFNDFMKMFRMPLFFFISGMLLSERYIDDPKVGVLRKLKGYYKPFVKWTIVFVLLHNVFASLYLIDSSNMYTLGETLRKCLAAFFLLNVEGAFLYQYWFLVSLTIASITSILFLWFLKRHNLLNNTCLMGGGNSLGNSGIVAPCHCADSNLWSSNTHSTDRSADVPRICVLHQRIYV